MKIRDKFDKILNTFAEENMSELFMDLYVFQILSSIASENLSQKNRDEVMKFFDRLKETIGNEEVKGK